MKPPWHFHGGWWARDRYTYDEKTGLQWRWFDLEPPGCWRKRVVVRGYFRLPYTTRVRTALILEAVEHDFINRRYLYEIKVRLGDHARLFFVARWTASLYAGAASYHTWASVIGAGNPDYSKSCAAWMAVWGQWPPEHNPWPHASTPEEAITEFLRSLGIRIIRTTTNPPPNHPS